MREEGWGGWGKDREWGSSVGREVGEEREQVRSVGREVGWGREGGWVRREVKGGQRSGREG